ncbi:MAG: ROK family protein [Candidatus Omnitrophica bacterium]|nr:ROK family protein [Candidatus Omnitrophota bacterium]
MAYRSLYKDEVLTDRERKNMIFLDVIRRNGPIAKTDIARITRHNIVTVSNYVESYIKAKLVVEKGLDVSSGGRRPELIELNHDWGFAVGVDIGPEHIIAVVTNLAPRIIKKAKMARPKGHMEVVIQEAIKLTQKLIESSEVDRTKIKGIGVGISGVIDKNAGTVRDTDPDRGVTVGNYISAKSILEKELNIPVSIGNDASLAALAEKKLSLRIDDENILYFYADVGAGIITKNDLFWGSSWSAGEIQLTMAELADLDLPEWVGKSHYFKSRGLDMGMVEAVKTYLSANPDNKSDLWEMAGKDLSKVTLPLILEAAKRGDKPVVEVIGPIVDFFGLKIAYLTNFLNPEVVVVGGGMEVGGDFVINRVRRVVKKVVMEEVSGNVKIILSRLGEDAVALGAVSLVTQELFAEV